MLWDCSGARYPKSYPDREIEISNEDGFGFLLITVPIQKGTFDSICLNCNQKAANLLNESDLAGSEVRHECSMRIDEDHALDRSSWGFECWLAIEKPSLEWLPSQDHACSRQTGPDCCE
jgi:hypothetical protein